jgi:hypothetical protein
MPKRTCIQCGQPLSGKQQRFCSDAHRSDYWNDLRTRAIEKPPVSSDDEIQAFFEDIMAVMSRHQNAVNKIASGVPNALRNSTVQDQGLDSAEVSAPPLDQEG